MTRLPLEQKLAEHWQDNRLCTMQTRAMPFGLHLKADVRPCTSYDPIRPEPDHSLPAPLPSLASCGPVSQLPF